MEPGNRYDGEVAAQREAILPLVAAGAGAAMVPETLARRAELLGAIIVEPRPAVTRRLVLAHRPGPLAPAAARFAELALAKRPRRRQSRRAKMGA